MRKKATRRAMALLSLLSLPVMLLVAAGGSAAAVPTTAAAGVRTHAVTSKSLGIFKPTFAGPAATGCAVNCNLLSGPVNTPSTAAAARGHAVAPGNLGKPDRARAMPGPDLAA